MSAVAAQALEVPATNERRVLIVDDDWEFAESLERVLRLRGYAVGVAFNAGAALALAAELRPHVALLDVRLGGTNGVDLIPDLRAELPDVQCVMMTAHAEADTAIQALRYAAADYLRKPFDPALVLQVLDRCFDKLATEAPGRTEHRLASVIERSPFATYVKDAAGRFVLVNPPFVSLFHCEGGIAGRDNAVFPERIVTAVEALELQARTIRAAVNGEFMVEDAGGRPRTYRLTCFAVADDLGGDEGVGGIFEDVSAFATLKEGAARASDNARAVAEASAKVLAFVNDEVRAPLADVGETLQQIDREVGARVTPATLALLRAAYHKCERLAQRVGNVLSDTKGAKARAPGPKPRRDTVGEVVRDATSAVAPDLAANGARLSTDCPADVSLLTVNGDVARTVLAAVLDTAGRLTPHGHVSLFVALSGHHVTFKVRDTGAGFDVNATAPTTLVLGEDTGAAQRENPAAVIAAASAACTAAGGTFTVHSAIGEGTTVGFALPLRSVPTAAA